MKKLLRYALGRLKEKSTWTGVIVVALTAIGITVEPELKELIIQAGIGIASLALFFVKESGSTE